jgi:multidrug efflux pump subunit AcrA (membrane-fusion protein)
MNKTQIYYGGKPVIKKYLSPMLLALLLSAVVMTTACSATPIESVAQAAPPVEEKTVPVEVATVHTGSMAEVLAYPGTLQPKDDVAIIPGAAGRIVSVLVEVGDEVQAGDPLAIIEDKTYLAQIKQAQAALTSAKLNLARMELGSRPEEIAAAQTGVDLARAQLNDVATISDDERTQAAAELARTQAALKAAQSEYDKIAWAGDVGATQQAQDLEKATIAYQDALANYNLAVNPGDSTLAPLMNQLAQAELQLALTLEPHRQVDFESARAAIAQAEAALELANIQLGEVVIKAPFDGTVAELNISQGSRVSQQTTVAHFLSQAMEVAVNVPESLISQVEKGQRAALQVSTYPGQDFPGQVTSIAPAADKATRTFEVKVTPSQGAERLRSGMYAKVSILAREKKNTLLAPLTAVTGASSEPFVYVVNGDNTVKPRPVKTGLSDREQIEILAGLKAGERVVTAGQPNLTAGAKVKLIKDKG